MNWVDLGDLNETLLVFGGPYSNLQATEALIAEAKGRGISPSHMICTGDIVAYCGDPAATVAAIRALDCPLIAGNCEKQLATNSLDCGCGFEEGSLCDRLSAGWFAHVDAQIDAEARAWMSDLPDVIVLRQAGRRIAVIHGGISDISRFLWSVSPEAEFDEEIAQLQALVGPVDMVLAGHCGVPFQREIGAITWINAGVIGMPPNDGASDTRYVLLSEGRAAFCTLSYPVEAAQRAMQTAGLTQGYDAALRSGYWPSEDVLPPDLRRAALAKG